MLPYYYYFFSNSIWNPEANLLKNKNGVANVNFFSSIWNNHLIIYKNVRTETIAQNMQ